MTEGIANGVLLFAIEIATRKVQCLGSTEHPDDSWMLDVADHATAGQNTQATSFL